MMSDLLEDLADRIERLETAEAARAALSRYAQAADTRDWAALADCFTSDAVMVMPGLEVVGGQAIADALRGMLPEGFITKHLIVNPQVEWRGPGRAQVRAVVYYAHEGAGFEAIGWGDYADEVVVVDGKGRIARMEFEPGQHLPGSIATVRASTEWERSVDLAREATWRYATAVDTADFDLLADAFTEDAVLTTSKGPREGREAVVDYYRNALAAPIARRHFLMNQKVAAADDGVMVESSFIYTYAGPDTSILGWGTYYDTVRIVDGVARISAKRIRVDVHADSRAGWATEADA